jgi:hypothetical protein
MTNSWTEAFASEPLDSFEDWNLLTEDQIELSAEQVTQASQWAQANSAQRWEKYLYLLARFAVQQWLSDRAPDLQVQTAFPSARSPISEISLLQVGAYQLQILTAGTFQDAIVSLPPNASGHPHFYVLVEVIEEQQQARVLGACNTLSLAQPTVASIQGEGDRLGSMARSQFTLDANALLLQLRCLHPSAFPLTPLLLTPHALLPPLINAATWLSNQLDELAQDLDWLLLPVSSGLTPAFRGQEQLEQIRQALEAVAVTIPPEARGASRELRWEGGLLRLYALVWELSNAEWSMLVVVGSDRDLRLSTGIQLQIRDQSQTLIDQTANTSLTNTCLYGQVVGDWGEPFWITVTTEDGAMFEIPPFTFDLGNNE